VGTGAAPAIRGLAQGLGRRLLAVPFGEDTIWAWFGGPRPLAAVDIERALSPRWPANLSLAAGEPDRGVDGRRFTHMQAQAAVGVALRRPQRLTRYLDVAVLASALQDDVLTRTLTAAYLAPLEAGRDSARLRLALRAYFAAGSNGTKAADALQISRRTMHNRITAINKRFGPLLHTRRMEFELALRLDEMREEHRSSRSPV